MEDSNDVPESSIVLATAEDASDLTAEGGGRTVMTRAQRRQMEKDAQKAYSDGLKAVTAKNLPAVLGNVLEKHVGPQIDRLDGRLNDLLSTMQSTVLDQMALLALLAEKGLMTNEEFTAKRVSVRENVRKMVEAARAAQQEDAPAADVNEQSPAFQEATKAAGGSTIHRLDEATAPSRIIRP